MRVHFREVRGRLSNLEKEMITSLLSTHYRVLVLGFVSAGALPHEAEARALTETDEHAKQMFSAMTIDVLPDAQH